MTERPAPQHIQPLPTPVQQRHNDSVTPYRPPPLDLFRDPVTSHRPPPPVPFRDPVTSRQHPPRDPFRDPWEDPFEGSGGSSMSSESDRIPTSYSDRHALRPPLPRAVLAGEKSRDRISHDSRYRPTELSEKFEYGQSPQKSNRPIELSEKIEYQQSPQKTTEKHATPQDPEKHSNGETKSVGFFGRKYAAFPNTYSPLESRSKGKERSADTFSTQSPDSDSLEKRRHEEKKSAGFFARRYAAFRATYSPVEDPPLILPSATTDEEKYLYLNMHRLPLYTFGIFSFLSLSAGMWLFVITSPIFYWFGIFVGLLELYLIISYAITLVGKDYDLAAHNKILADYPITPEDAPTVDIYLPCCKEPLEILANTYKYVKALQWPEGKLKVYVLDDGGMDSVKQLATSFGYNYIVRDDRPRLKKAGNLRWAFTRTQGDFFAIFDADFCPRADFLTELVPQHLADNKTAIVQSPQFFRVRSDQTWVEQGAGSIQELFYRVVQVNRNRWGASICVGSNAIYRREALAEVGGTAEIGFSEDVHTGFYAVDRGWKVKYVPLCMACGVCPDTPQAFFSQQMRWCMGSTTLLTNKDFWKSNLNLVQKLCYMSGMMYYSAISISIFLNPLPGILMIWVRPEYFKYYNLAFAVPSLVYALLAFRWWAKSSYNTNVQYIMVIQSYAYMTAIKDRIFGRALAWVPSGDNASHRNNKYRNMRILCWCWQLGCLGMLATALAYRTATDSHFHLYNAVPLILLDSMNFFFAHRFLFYTKKKR